MKNDLTETAARPIVPRAIVSAYLDDHIRFLNPQRHITSKKRLKGEST